MRQDPHYLGDLQLQRLSWHVSVRDPGCEQTTSSKEQHPSELGTP